MEKYSSYNPDVLNCLANLSSDEVFTPPDVANRLLDELPEELFSSPTSTFLDPSSKSGVFLREIAKRLIQGLSDAIPDIEKRVEHIITKQLYGVATTELTGLISRRSLYCAKRADSEFSVVQSFNNSDGNILFEATEHTWVRGKCSFCGASKQNYDRGEFAESYAYKFLHVKDPKEIFKMKFDVVIGNPPYQMSDGGHGKSAKPIYHKFVEQAKRLNPRFLVMIIPSRWFAGGKGLDDFREAMLGDSRIKKIVDFPDARDCFPGVDIAGGVCYFLWDRAHQGSAEVLNIWRDTEQRSIRKLDEFNTFVRFGLAADVVKKVAAFAEKNMSSVVSSRKPFGLPTNIAPLTSGELTLIANSGKGPFPRDLINNGHDLIDRWKVLTSKVSYDHAGQPNKEGQRRVLSKILVAPPGTVCTETYLVAGSFDTQEECENLVKYLKLKFTRFLIAQMSFSQDITKDRFTFVPTVDSHTSLTDTELFAKYGLSEEEEAFIESTIMEMS